MTSKRNQAEDLGIARAQAEYAAGATAPHPDPLSGEWADDFTVQGLASYCGELDSDMFDDLADAYETGYAGRWEELLSDIPGFEGTRAALDALGRN